MRRTHWLAAASLLAASLSSVAHAQIPLISDRTDWSGPAAAWWSHVQFLADDKLEGRRAGTPGYEKAVAYVEEQFKSIGLKPMGTAGYQQSFELIPTTVENDKSKFSFEHDGKTIDFVLGKDATLGAAPSNSAPLARRSCSLATASASPRSTLTTSPAWT